MKTVNRARDVDTPLGGSAPGAPPLASSGLSASLSSEKNGVESDVGSPRDMAVLWMKPIDSTDVWVASPFREEKKTRLEAEDEDEDEAAST